MKHETNLQISHNRIYKKRAAINYAGIYGKNVVSFWKNNNSNNNKNVSSFMMHVA
jgi:hypothetical protein